VIVRGIVTALFLCHTAGAHVNGSDYRTFHGEGVSRNNKILSFGVSGVYGKNILRPIMTGIVEEKCCAILEWKRMNFHRMRPYAAFIEKHILYDTEALGADLLVSIPV